jgi:hypothetical protein
MAEKLTKYFQKKQGRCRRTPAPTETVIKAEETQQRKESPVLTIVLIVGLLLRAVHVAHSVFIRTQKNFTLHLRKPTAKLWPINLGNVVKVVITNVSVEKLCEA